MSLDRNAQALIDLVRDDARRRGEDALARARAEAALLVREAYREARRNMHRAFDDARRHGRERLGAAQAMLETKQRLARQRHNAALLAACWQSLPDALVARWNGAGTRSAWILRAVAEAERALARGRWRIAHPPGWPTSERDAVAADVTRATGEAPELCEDAALRAGLSISVDGTSIDATLDGLLADRADIGAMLLQRLDEADEADEAAR